MNSLLRTLAAVCICLPSVPTRAEEISESDRNFRLAFAGQIEAAHGVLTWQRQDALSADITVSFGGEKMLEGKLLFEIGSERCRLELTSGTVMVWDGARAWITPPEANQPPGARFHVRTWPYFVAVPFKLRDPGSRLEDLGHQPFPGDRQVPAARLTFGDAVGDAPDDWYVVYRDPDSNTLRAMAYIVTYGKSAEEAEKDPHAIVYDQFQTVDNVTLATDWKFHAWSNDQGIHGEPMGHATLRNVKFTTAEDAEFARPEGAVEDKLPDK